MVQRPVCRARWWDYRYMAATVQVRCTPVSYKQSVADTIAILSVVTVYSPDIATNSLVVQRARPDVIFSVIFIFSGPSLLHRCS